MRTAVLAIFALLFLLTGDVFATSTRARPRARGRAQAPRVAIPPALRSIQQRLTTDPRAETRVSLSNIRCAGQGSAAVRCTVQVTTPRGARTDIADPEIVAPFLRARLPFSSETETADFPVKIQVAGTREVIRVLDLNDRLLAERIPRSNGSGNWRSGIFMGVDCTLAMLQATRGYCHLLMRMTADRSRTGIPDTSFLIQPAIGAPFSAPRQPRRNFAPRDLQILTIPAAENRREIILVKNSRGDFISQKINYLR